MKAYKPIHILLAAAFLLRFLLAVLYPSTGDACYHEMNVLALLWEKGPIDMIGNDPLWTPYAYHAFVAIVAGLFSLVGLYKLGVVLPNIFLGTLGIYILYKIVHLYTKKEHTAFLAAAFLALFPMHVFYSAVLYVDVPMLTFFLLSIYYIMRERPALAGLFAAFAILTKSTGIVVFPVIGLLYLYKKNIWKKSWWKSLIVFGLIAVILGTPFLVRNTFKYGSALSVGGSEGVFGRSAGPTTDNILSQATLSKQYYTLFAIPQGKLFDALAFLPVSKTLQQLGGITWILLSLLLLLPFFVGFAKGYKKYSFISWTTLIILALHTFGTAILGTESNARYSIGILLPLAFFFAKGVEALRIPKKHYSVYAIFILLIFVIPFFLQAKIAHAHIAKRGPVYDAIHDLPVDTKIFGQDRCAEVHLKRVLPYVWFANESEFLGPQTEDIYLFETNAFDTIPAHFQEGIKQEYTAVVSAEGSALLKKKR